MKGLIHICIDRFLASWRFCLYINLYSGRRCRSGVWARRLRALQTLLCSPRQRCLSGKSNHNSSSSTLDCYLSCGRKYPLLFSILDLTISGQFFLKYEEWGMRVFYGVQLLESKNNEQLLKQAPNWSTFHKVKKVIVQGIS